MRLCFVLLALSASAWAQFPAAGPATAEVSPDTVVATVGDKDVTLADVRKMIDADPRLLQFMQQNPSQALSNFFVLKSLAEEGERRKLAEQSPLKEQLEVVRAQILAGQLINLERDTFPVSSEAIDAYFLKNRSAYEQARVRVIQVAFKPSAAASGAGAGDVKDAALRALQEAHSGNDRTEEKTKALAEEIVKKIRDGADFLKMVEQYTEDPAGKVTGGDFGLIKSNGSTPEEIRKAVFSTKEGDVSNPVKSGNWFYIIRVDEKSVPPITEVRESIVQAIRQEHLGAYMTQMNNRFKPVVKSADFFARPGQFLQPR